MRTVALAPKVTEREWNCSRLPHPEQRDIASRTLWIFVALAIAAVEALIPRIPLFPWLKPGFSNAVTILWIIEYGTADALLFSFLRVWISGFYVGFSLFSLGLGLCGAACATLSMGLLWRCLGSRRWLGTVGLGICGACFHNAGQLAALALLLGEAEKLFVQVPVMLAASLVFGGLTGWMVVPLGRFLASRSDRYVLLDTVPPVEKKISRKSLFVSIGILAVSLGLLAIKQVWVLGACAALATVLAFAVTKSLSIVLRRGILRFWMLFLFIALTNCLQPSGTILWHVPFLTREAVLEPPANGCGCGVGSPSLHFLQKPVLTGSCSMCFRGFFGGTAPLSQRPRWLWFISARSSLCRPCRKIGVEAWAKNPSIDGALMAGDDSRRHRATNGKIDQRKE